MPHLNPSPPEHWASMSAVNRYLFLMAALLAVHGWTAALHARPWTAFYNEWPFFAALGLLAISALNIRQARLRFPLVFLIPSLLVFAPLIQHACGKIVFLGDAVMPALYLGALAFSGLVGGRLDTTAGNRFARTLAAVLLAGALLSLILASQQWLGIDVFGIWLTDAPSGGRPYGNLAQPNNLATLFSLGLGALLYLRESGQLNRVLLWLAALLLMSGVAMTRSRTALVTLIALYLWLLVWRPRLRLRTSVMEATIGLMLSVGLWLAWPAISTFVDAQAAVRSVADNSSSLRLLIWRELLDAAFRQPWSGWGWNQVSVAQAAVATQYPPAVLVEHAHNIILDLLLWNGVVLGGAIAVLSAIWFVSRSRALDTLEAWFGMTAWVVVGVHGMLEFPLEYAYFLLPLGLCAGIVENRHPGAPSVTLSSKGIAAIALIMGGGLGLVFTEYLKIESDYRQMSIESARIGPLPPIPTAPNVWLLSAQREFIRFARTEAREGMSKDELIQMGEVAQRFPFPPVLFRYALALAMNGDSEQAKLQLDRLRHLHPPARWEEAMEGLETMARQTPQLQPLHAAATTLSRKIP